MTEAAHQMTSDSSFLANRESKHGTVGRPHGTVEVAILDGTGRCVTSPNLGEICVRGANVTSGYMGNPEANSKSFVKCPPGPKRSDCVLTKSEFGRGVENLVRDDAPWFKTGDQGYIDADGFLFITGRLKELINRGGEKIMPSEIDNVLLKHPNVLERVCFGVPDKKYGETVGAAIILRDRKGSMNARDTEKELLEFCGQNLLH